MARVTVEDCIERVPNRFELVLLAVQRSRDIKRGELLTIKRGDEKNPVLALREIAEQKIIPDALRERVVQRLQKVVMPSYMADKDSESASSAQLGGVVESGNSDFSAPASARKLPSVAFGVEDFVDADPGDSD